jgi:PhnB protein
VGNNVAICLNTESEEESRRLFEALGQGGTVRMPLEPTFWAPRYGVVCAQFGIEWMVNYEAEPTA